MEGFLIMLNKRKSLDFTLGIRFSDVALVDREIRNIELLEFQELQGSPILRPFAEHVGDGIFGFDPRKEIVMLPGFLDPDFKYH
jgi:hypothetical protein